MSEVQQINVSERVSYLLGKDRAELVINGKVERWKETLLVMWLAAWLFCGLVVFREFMVAEGREFKLMLFVFLVFWAFYLWRIGRVWRYRTKGFERILLSHGELSIAVKAWGKPSEKRYFIENMGPLKKIEIPERSFAFTHENMWWVMGGERLGFDYGDQLVRFAMQLNDQDTAAVLRFFKKYLPKHRGSR